jgi:hypothetical protein
MKEKTVCKIKNMDEQSLPRLMAEIMVGCQSGNKIICYSKLRQGAKWIMLNDPPPDDSPSQLTVDLGTPVNDEYTHPGFIEDHPSFAKEHGVVPDRRGVTSGPTMPLYPHPGQGWNAEMSAGLSAGYSEQINQGFVFSWQG